MQKYALIAFVMYVTSYLKYTYAEVWLQCYCTICDWHLDALLKIICMSCMWHNCMCDRLHFYTCVARARLLVTARSPLAESQIAAVASHTGPDAAHMRIVNSGWCSFVRAGHKTECMVSKNWGHDRHLYVSTMHHVQLTHASSRQCAHACLKIWIKCVCRSSLKWLVRWRRGMHGWWTWTLVLLPPFQITRRRNECI